MTVPAHPSETDLIAYSSEELSSARARVVEDHVKGCDICQREVATWRNLRRHTSTYFQAQIARTPLPADGWTALEAAMTRSNRHTAWTPPMLLRPLTILILAVVLFAGLGIGLSRFVANQAALLPFMAPVAVPTWEPSPIPPTLIMTSTAQPTETPSSPSDTEVPSESGPVQASQVPYPAPPEMPISTIPVEMFPATATPPVFSTSPSLPTPTVTLLPSATQVSIPTIPPPTLTPTIAVEPTLPSEMPTHTPENGNQNGGGNGNGNGNGGGNGTGNEGNGNQNEGGNGNGNNGNGNGNGGGNGNN